MPYKGTIEDSIPSQGQTSQEVSDFETQFVPQPDDEENLWEVVKITAERHGEYKVVWAGLNPETQKKWPDSWVRKRDCTPGAVKEWKKQKALKAKGRKCESLV